MMNSEEKEKIYLSCACCCGVLVSENMGNEVAIAIYKKDIRFSLMNRIYLIWKILTKGHPYTDEILLQMEDVQKLGNFLNKKVSLWKKQQKSQ